MKSRRFHAAIPRRSSATFSANDRRSARACASSCSNSCGRARAGEPPAWPCPGCRRCRFRRAVSPSSRAIASAFPETRSRPGGRLRSIGSCPGRSAPSLPSSRSPPVVRRPGSLRHAHGATRRSTMAPALARFCGSRRLEIRAQRPGKGLVPASGYAPAVGHRDWIRAVVERPSFVFGPDQDQVGSSLAALFRRWRRWEAGNPASGSMRAADSRAGPRCPAVVCLARIAVAAGRSRALDRSRSPRGRRWRRVPSIDSSRRGRWEARGRSGPSGSFAEIRLRGEVRQSGGSFASPCDDEPESRIRPPE